MERVKIMEDTELIKMPPDKFRFVHTKKTKVAAKMFDYNCDVKLKVGKEIFSAHKDVLSESSDYFAAMFSHDMREKDQEAVELLGISAKGFTQLLEYFYHGHITIEANGIENCLEAARFFHIEWLIYVCCYFLIYNTSVENFDSVLVLADRFAVDNLKADVFSFIGQNFMQLVDENKIAHLSHDILEKLLSAGYFVCASERDILSAVMKWLQEDPESRETYAESLLSYIKFGLMHPDDVESLPEELNKYASVMEAIDEAKLYLCNPFAQCLLHAEKTSIRGCVPAIGFVAAIDDSDVIQYKVPGNPGFRSEVLTSSDLESIYEYCCTAVLGNFVFVVGGYNRRYISTPQVYRLDIRFKIWLEVAPMNHGRTSFGLCEDGKGLYVVGGVNHKQDDTEELMKSAERYDPRENEWLMLPDYPKSCFETAAASWNERVFVSGGISESDDDPLPLHTMYCYDPLMKEWIENSPMLSGRQGHSMKSHEGKLYVFGGHTSGKDPANDFSPPTFTDSFSNEVYDIETNQWTEIASTAKNWGHLERSSTILDGKIYLVGGKHLNRYLYTYDIESKKFLEDDQSEGENCGPYIRSVIAIDVPFPFNI